MFARKRDQTGRSPEAGRLGLRNLFTLPVLLGILGIAAALLLGTLLLMFLRPEEDPGAPAASAALTSIPAPTSTLRPAPQMPTAAVELQPTATLLPGEIGTGVFVQISGTEGSGLRVRSEPGLNANSLFLGLDSEVFTVVDGPVDADGHTWWKLSASYDSTRTGWAVQDYLVVIASP